MAIKYEGKLMISNIVYNWETGDVYYREIRFGDFTKINPEEWQLKGYQ